MACKSIFHKSISHKIGIAVAICACALPIKAVSVVRADAPAEARSAVAGPGASGVAVPERIVVHGLRFRAGSDEIDASSLPVLDYAIWIIRETPGSLIYLKAHLAVRAHSVRDFNHNYAARNFDLTDRRTRAVASYLERKGISAKRLILPDFRPSAYAFNEDAGKVQIPVNSKVLQLDFTS